LSKKPEVNNIFLKTKFQFHKMSLWIIITMLFSSYFRFLGNSSFTCIEFMLLSVWPSPKRCFWNMSIAGQEGRHLSPENDGKKG